MAALFADRTIEQIAAAKPSNGSQVLFQQLYANSNFSIVETNVRRAEKAGSKALVFTIDAPATAIRHRAARDGTGSANTDSLSLTWDLFHRVQNLTTLPVIPKGIQTAEDAKLAVQNGAKAIYLSNHGGRTLDGSPSALEVAIDIYENAPEVFKQTEVLADGGVRYGTDALKLLALGVKAVGLGRPYEFTSL